MDQPLNQNNIENRIGRVICEAISEGLEIMKPENIEDVNRAIQDLYAKYIKEISKRSRKVNPYADNSIHVGGQWRGMYIYVTVDDSQFKDNSTPRYHGSYRHRAGEDDDVYKSIWVTINHLGMKDYPTFREILMHEMSHYLDDKRGRIGNDESGARYILNYVVNDKTYIGDILYRLWTETERNAYSTKVLYGSPDKYKEYLQSLSDEIDKIESFQDNNANVIHIWRRIGAILFPSKVRPNTPWMTIRDMFVKKSRFLLSKMGEKYRQRYAQHVNRQDINPNMKDLEYRGKHYDDMKKASEQCYYYIIRDKDLSQFSENLKQQGIRLNKQAVKNIWKEELKKIIKAFEGESDMVDKVNRMKQQLSEI